MGPKLSTKDKSMGDSKQNKELRIRKCPIRTTAKETNKI